MTTILDYKDRLFYWLLEKIGLDVLAGVVVFGIVAASIVGMILLLIQDSSGFTVQCGTDIYHDARVIIEGESMRILTGEATYIRSIQDCSAWK